MVVMWTFALLACLCGGVPTHEASFEKAKVVFEGVVVSKRVVLHHDLDGYWRPAPEYEFAVVRQSKGEPSQRFTLIDGGTGCSRHFAAGRRYVVTRCR